MENHLILRRGLDGVSQPLFMSKSKPAIFHYDLSSHQSVWILLKKCTKTPVNLVYYFLPDFESIKNRPVDLD